MEYFIIVAGRIKELTKEEFESLHATDVHDYIKNVSPDKLKEFQRRRYETLLNR